MDNIQQSEFECGVHRGMGELDKPVGMIGFGKCT
jgi:hypothetical protein